MSDCIDNHNVFAGEALELGLSDIFSYTLFLMGATHFRLNFLKDSVFSQGKAILHRWVCFSSFSLAKLSKSSLSTSVSIKLPCALSV